MKHLGTQTDPVMVEDLDFFDSYTNAELDNLEFDLKMIQYHGLEWLSADEKETASMNYAIVIEYIRNHIN